MEGTLAGEPRAPWPILEIAGGGRAAGQWPRLAAETTGKLQASSGGATVRAHVHAPPAGGAAGYNTNIWYRTTS